jgi:hypothetical protein
MVDKGDDKNLRGFKSGHKSFSICVCRVDLHVRMVVLHFMRGHPNIGNSEKLPWSIDFTMWIVQGRVMVLCKTCEVVSGEFLCVVNLKNGVKHTGLCSMFGLRDLCWKCNKRLGFLLKFDVVLGSYDLKILRRRRKVNGFKRERSEWFDPLETSSISLLK